MLIFYQIFILKRCHLYLMASNSGILSVFLYYLNLLINQIRCHLILAFVPIFPLPFILLFISLALQ